MVLHRLVILSRLIQPLGAARIGRDLRFLMMVGWERR